MPDPINKRDLLKQRFVPNSVPTAQDFHDLIDSVLIQEDDGVARIVPDPLNIEGESARLETIRLYKDFENDPSPTWLIEMKPRTVDTVPSTSQDGLSIANAAKESLLFIQESPEGRIGIGTINPEAKLHITTNSGANEWRYSEIQDQISLELGKNGTGKLGSIKLNGYENNQFCLVRPSSGNYHVDSTKGGYYFNWDNENIPGCLYVGGTNAADVIKLNSDGDSYLNGGYIGIGTTTPQAKLQVVGGAIMPQVGNNFSAGILFPVNAFGGGGDGAWIRYYARGGEETTLEIGTSNDASDNIALISPGGVGINTNEPEHALDVKGEVKTDQPYYIKTQQSFKVEGDANKWYPIVILDEDWEGGILEMELNRADVHTDSQWRGSLMSKLSFHSTKWGHGSEYWSVWVRQKEDSNNPVRFLNGVENSFYGTHAVIWLKGGGTTYYWRSNHKMSIVDSRALESKTYTDAENTLVTVESKSKIEPAYDFESFQFDSHGLLSNNQVVPQGLISMYSGATAPAGWAFCDGSNGTPDLRGRFILGAGQGSGLSNRIVGQVGGLQSVTLSLAQLPAHKHGLNDPGHFHTWTASRQLAGTDDNNNSRELSRGDNGTDSPVVKDTNTKTTGITMNDAGSNAAHENMPPFYVLAYIMKL